MKNIQAFLSLAFILLLVTMSSCEVIGDIFQAGMWFAVIVIAIVILLILWIVRKLRGPRTRL
jgi:predicted lysophospholipase L1 biosynthesis ABC-type transport system permease subunit